MAPKSPPVRLEARQVGRLKHAGDDGTGNAYEHPVVLLKVEENSNPDRTRVLVALGTSQKRDEEGGYEIDPSKDKRNGLPLRLTRPTHFYPSEIGWVKPENLALDPLARVSSRCLTELMGVHTSALAVAAQAGKTEVKEFKPPPNEVVTTAADGVGRDALLPKRAGGSPAAAPAVPAVAAQSPPVSPSPKP